MRTRNTAWAAIFGLCLLSATPSRATNFYVSVSGSHTYPYTNWATAATNIEPALALASAWGAHECIVSNGHYVLTNTLSLNYDTVLRSVNGPEVTIIDGGDARRCVEVTGQGILRGFTVTRGRRADFGGGASANSQYAIIDRCIFVSNAAPYAAAVYLVGDGTLRNSILMANTNGAVYCHWSGNVDNCLVLSNRTDATSGGAVYVNYGANIRNTVSYHNTGTAARPNWQLNGTATASMFQFCTITPDIGSPTCFTDVPDFVDDAAGNYRFFPGSLWVDAGTNLSWMATAQDLDGNPRTNGPVDIGPYELTAGPLVGSFSGVPASGGEPLAVTLTAAVEGTNQTSLYYRWDVDDDGNVDAEGTGLAVLVTNFSAGLWSVNFSVSNAAGEVSARTRSTYISVSPSTLYVVESGGTPTPPYGSWATAATNIQDAIDEAAAGTLVLVSNGTFTVSTPVTIAKSLTVRGVGAGGTVIDGGGASRCATLEHAGALLESVTLRNGYASEGGGAYIRYGGTLSDCVIADNDAVTNGGGLYLYQGGLVHGCTVVSNSAGTSGGGIFNDGTGGTVSNCTVGWNSSPEGAGYMGSSGTRVLFSLIASNTATSVGGGIRCTGNYSSHEIRNCVLRGNTATFWGGGIYVQAVGTTTIRNCLFTGNSAGQSGGAMWAHTAGLDMDACTVVGNTASIRAGGVELAYQTHTIVNSISYNNIAPAGANWFTTETVPQDVTFSFCCLAPLPSDGTNNLNEDPIFINADEGDYALRSGSPCIDAGTNQAWMASAIDLAGNPRIQRSGVDIGAYEAPPKRGTIVLIQ